MHVVVGSRRVYDQPGYRTLVGRVRSNIRALIRKHLELPRQEIGEIMQANLRAARVLAIAAAFALLFAIALVVFLVALLALVLPLWASALIVLLLCGIAAAAFGYAGYKRLELHGPTRSINSFKETVQWARARLRGRSAS